MDDWRNSRPRPVPCKAPCMIEDVTTALSMFVLLLLGSRGAFVAFALMSVHWCLFVFC